MTKRRALLFAATTLGVIVLDQLTKALVRESMRIGESHRIVDNILWLTHVNNTGAAFGMFRGHQWMLIIVAALVLGVIAFVAWHLRPESVVARTALAFIAAGAAGNLIDRVALGGVTDFIDFGWWPVFNVADMSLDIGVALLVWWVLFSKESAQQRSEHGPSAE